MNKLTALYAVMKNVQDMKSGKTPEVLCGQMESSIHFGELEIASAKGESNCTEEQCVKKAEIKFGSESMKFEHSGKSASCCSGPGHSHLHLHMKNAHGFRSMPAGKPHRKFNRLGHAMMMIKLLDQMTYEEMTNGQRVLSLEMTMADLPEPVRAQMEAHLKHKRAHLKAMMACCGEDCCTTDQAAEETCCGPNANCCETDSACCEAETNCCEPDSNCCEPANCCEDDACCSSTCCSDQCCSDNCCSSNCCAGGNIHKQAFEWLKVSGLTQINPDSVTPEKVSIQLFIDETGKPLEAKMSLSIHAETVKGEVKPLRFSFNGKML